MQNAAQTAGYATDILGDRTLKIHGGGVYITAYYLEGKFQTAWIYAKDSIPLQRISSTLLRKFLRGEYYPHKPSVVPVALRPYVTAIAEERIP